MFTHERLPDWTIRWAEFVKDCLDISSDLRLDWENTTCTSFCAQGIEVLTGHNPFEEGAWAGTFTNTWEAAKEIRKRHFETLDDLIANLFPEIPLAYAWPGDVVLIKAIDWNAEEESKLVMPHGVALADPPVYLAVTEEGFGKGDLYGGAVRAFGIGHTV